MRNRLASLIVVKQEPSSNPLNSTLSVVNSLPTLPDTTTTSAIIPEINNNQVLHTTQNPHITSTSANISIKSENSLCEINNNHLSSLSCDNYFDTTNTNSNNLPQKPSATLIYPCRNLFPDGCDISHNHNCSTFVHHNSNHNHHHHHHHYYAFGNLQQKSQFDTLSHHTNGQKFLFKSEPLIPNNINYQSQQHTVSASGTNETSWSLTNLNNRRLYNNHCGSSTIQDNYPNIKNIDPSKLNSTD
uniref:Uncharacterized protein n=1 Tax=Glossina austeni TaxID=7395 RepID=A0A1A9VI61_GLOAU